MNPLTKSALSLVVIITTLVSVLWWSMRMRPAGLPSGIVSGNGRIEATEIDIATKTPGRIVEILVREGDFVESGEVLARMDMQVLLAQLAEGQPQVRQAQNAF